MCRCGHESRSPARPEKATTGRLIAFSGTWRSGCCLEWGLATVRSAPPEAARHVSSGPVWGHVDVTPWCSSAAPEPELRALFAWPAAAACGCNSRSWRRIEARTITPRFRWATVTWASPAPLPHRQRQDWDSDASRGSGPARSWWRCCAVVQASPGVSGLDPEAQPGRGSRSRLRHRDAAETLLTLRPDASYVGS